jgi:hypothetical protein
VSEFYPYQFDRRFRPVAAPEPSPGGMASPSPTMSSLSQPSRTPGTPLQNDAHVTGPYRWWTAVGPRFSFADDGLTFGTNPHAGLCIHFHNKIKRVIGFRDHSALTVTVADPHALEARLSNGRE